MVRLWAGILLAIVGLVWGIIPFALLWGLIPLSQIGGLILFGVIVWIVYRLVPPSTHSLNEHYSNYIWYAACGISAILCILLFLHVLYPKDGALFAGPSTYGDLPSHLSMITSMAEQKQLAHEYSVFPGAPLKYPFFINVLSASLYLSGLPLRWAILLPSFLLALAVAGGFLFFAREVLKKDGAAILAAILLFFNGGFGFAYFMEGLRQNPENLTRLFSGFYFSPTNWYDKNLYLFNAICHILVPQRTSLAGWALLFFILWLLQWALKTGRLKYFLTAGVLGGLLLMIHSSSFLNLCCVALIWFFVYYSSSDKKNRYLQMWAVFWAAILLLALPQYWHWLAGPGAKGKFMWFYLGWANKTDWWVWFWIKNGGLVFLLAIPAFISADRRLQQFYSGAIALFIFGETILITPVGFDNNKIFHIWYAMTAIVVAGFLMDIYGRMKGLRGRGLFLGMLILAATFSGILTVAHDLRTSYQVFSAEDIAVAVFVRKNTPPDALFISSDFHNNPVTALAGRKTLCGYRGWLHAHGIDYTERCEDVTNMFVRPVESEALFEKYNVDYVYFSGHERTAYNIEEKNFETLYPKIYSEADIRIYAVSPRTQPSRYQ